MRPSSWADRLLALSARFVGLIILIATLAAAAGSFLYNRAEFKCEGPVFDACMTAFAANRTIQSAVSAIARDPGFCQ